MVTFLDISRVIEEYASLSYDAGFTAGVNATKMPWQNIESAPKDGVTILLVVGSRRCTGFWNASKNTWVQEGTGRALMPSMWMHLPVVPGFNKHEFVPRKFDAEDRISKDTFSGDRFP